MLWGGPVVIIVFILFWLIYVLRNLTEGFTQKILESGTNKLILIQFKKFPKIFFKVLKEIISKNNDIEKDIEILISGTIDTSIYNYLMNDSILKTKINYVENIEYEKTFNHFDSSSLLLLLLNKNSVNTTPTKVFDYASSGTPVLTLGEKKDRKMDLLLKELSLEKIISYSDKISIEKSILKSYQNFKLKIKNKPSENIKKYDRKYLTKKLSKILDYYH